MHDRKYLNSRTTAQNITTATLMMIDDGDSRIKLAIVVIWKTVMLGTEGAKRTVGERLDELRLITDLHSSTWLR
jgi:hypothetical protein